MPHHSKGGPISQQETDSDREYWSVKRILQESRGRYKVEWEGVNPTTGKPWPPSWVAASDCTPDLIENWDNRKRKKQVGKKSSKAQVDVSPKRLPSSKKRPRNPSSDIDGPDHLPDGGQYVVRKLNNRTQQQKLNKAYPNGSSKPSKQKHRTPTSSETGPLDDSSFTESAPQASHRNFRHRRSSMSISPNAQHDHRKSVSKLASSGRAREYDAKVSARVSGSRRETDVEDESEGYKEETQEDEDEDEDDDRHIHPPPSKKRKLLNGDSSTKRPSARNSIHHASRDYDPKGKKKQTYTEEEEESSSEEDRKPRKSTKFGRPSTSKSRSHHPTQQLKAREESDNSDVEEDPHPPKVEATKRTLGPAKAQRSVLYASTGSSLSKPKGKTTNPKTPSVSSRRTTFAPASFQKKITQNDRTQSRIEHTSQLGNDRASISLYSDEERGPTKKIPSRNSPNLRQRTRSEVSDESAESDGDNAKSKSKHGGSLVKNRVSESLEQDAIYSLDGSPVKRSPKVRRHPMRIAESTQESALDKSPPRHQTTSPHSPQTGRRSRIHHVETSMIQNDVEAGPWTESDEEEEAEINASLGSLGAHDANLSDDPNQVPEDLNSRAQAFDPNSQNPDISKGTIISDSQPSQAQTHSQQSPSFHRRHPSSPIHTGQSQDSPTTRHVSKSTKRLGSKVEVVIPVLGLNHQGLLVESSVMESPEHSKKAMFPSPSRTKISPSTLLRSIASSPATSRALGPLPNLSPTQFKPYIHSGKQGASGTVDDSLSQIESFESPLSKRRIGIRSNGPDELVDEIEEIEDEPPDRSGSRDWESVGFKGPRTDEKPKRPLSDFLKPSTSVTDTLTEDDGVQEDVQASMDQDVPESESRNMNAVVDTSQPVVPPSQITDDSIISVNVAPPLPPKEAREVQVQTQSSVADSQALIDEIKATHTAELSKLRETISRLEDQTAESERNLRLSNDNVDTLNITLDYIKSLKESGDSDLENMKDLYRSAAARSADLEDDNRKLRKEIEKLEGQVQFSSKQVRLSFEAEIGMYKERLKAQDHHVKFVMEQAKRTGIKLSAGEGDEEEVAKGDEVRRRAAEWSMLSKEVAKLKKTVAEAGEKEEMLRVLLGEAEQRTSQRSTALRELRKSNLQLETDITNLRQESENWKELARQREDVWTCEWINLETRKQCGAEFTDLENAKNHVENEHAREEVLRPNGAPM